MVKEAGAKKSPGRPEKFPGEGARIGHSLRIKPSVDRVVRAAAEKNCRSISEEIENRLNQTVEKAFVAFDDDQLLARIREDAVANHREVWTEAQIKIRNAICIEDIFKHRGTYALLLLIARDMSAYEHSSSRSLMQELEDQTSGMDAYQRVVGIISNRILSEVEQSRRVKEMIAEREERDQREADQTAESMESVVNTHFG